MPDPKLVVEVGTAAGEALGRTAFGEAAIAAAGNLGREAMHLLGGAEADATASTVRSGTSEVIPRMLDDAHSSFVHGGRDPRAWRAGTKFFSFGSTEFNPGLTRDAIPSLEERLASTRPQPPSALGESGAGRPAATSEAPATGRPAAASEATGTGRAPAASEATATGRAPAASELPAAARPTTLSELPEPAVTARPALDLRAVESGALKPEAVGQFHKAAADAPSTSALSQVFRGIFDRSEEILRQPGGKQGFVQMTSGADGTIEAKLLDGPLVGSEAVWAKGDPHMLVQTSEGEIHTITRSQSVGSKVYVDKNLGVHLEPTTSH